MQEQNEFLSHKAVKTARKRANEALQLKHNEFRCDRFVGLLGFHDHEVDVESFVRFLERREKCLLERREFIHETDHGRLDRFGGIRS